MIQVVLCIIIVPGLMNKEPPPPVYNQPTGLDPKAKTSPGRATGIATGMERSVASRDSNSVSF